MTMNPLPPQAYTKDTLVKAFQWIQLQPDNIKELASTPDVLVSLYLKAKLQGEAALERPSIQNFKSELKNLAGQLGEFDSFQGRLNEGISMDRPLPQEKPSDRQEKLQEKNQEKPFERPSATTFAPTPSSQSAAPSFTATQQRSHAAPLGAPQNTHQAAHPAAPQSSATSAPLTTTVAMDVSSSLDPRSLDSKSLVLVQEIRQRCNLQSDAEALRLLISIGHSQLKNLLR